MVKKEYRYSESSPAFECDSVAQPLVDRAEPGVGVQLYLYQAGVTLTLEPVLTSIAGFAFLDTCSICDWEPVPALLLSAGFLPLPFLYVRHRRQASTSWNSIARGVGMMSALSVWHSLIAIWERRQDSREPISGKFASVSRNKTTVSTCARARESHPEALYRLSYLLSPRADSEGKWRESGRSVEKWLRPRAKGFVEEA